jgi:transcriptional regulator with XRE-family HTH domain
MTSTITTPLRKLRLARKLTLLEVAKQTGLDPGGLSRIETGRQTSLEAAAKLVEFFGPAAISELEILYPARFSSGGEDMAPDAECAVSTAAP